MKKFQIIVFLSLIIHIYLDCYSVNSPSIKTCRFAISESEKIAYSHCCYYKYTLNNNQKEENCLLITRDLYDHIDSYIESLEIRGLKVDSLDCKSSYQKLGILVLLTLLI